MLEATLTFFIRTIDIVLCQYVKRDVTWVISNPVTAWQL